MSPELLNLIFWSTLDTLTMVALAGSFGTLLGLSMPATGTLTSWIGL